MSLRTLVVANPVSGHGAARRALGGLQARMRELLGPYELGWTRGPRDAERLAREGVRAGVERVLVAGGDGTASEVVTGLLAADLGGYAEVGLLPLGTGGDLARTLGLPRDPSAALDQLAAGRTRPMDAGCLRWHDGAGQLQTRYFANVASIGLSGLVTETVNRATKVLGGRISFLLGTLRAVGRYQPRAVTLQLDGETVHEGPLVLATAANGRFFGGGMQVAPAARSDDGLLDVVVIAGVSRARLVAELPRLYRGTHLRLDPVSLHRGRRLRAEAEPGTVWWEADGEPHGTLPLEIEVLPGALRVVGWAA